MPDGPYPPPFPLPERRRLLKYIDARTFPRVIGEIIRNHPDLRRCSYSASHPKEDTQDLPRIVYRLYRQTPGINGIEAFKPRLRYSFPNEDGSLTEIWAQWQTCIFQFDVCAPSGDEAEDLCWELNHLLREAVGTILSLGAREMTFDERLVDHLLPDVKGVQVRSLRWQVILEEMESRTLPTIQQITVKTFLPQEEYEEAVVRGNYPDDPAIDLLAQTHVGHVYHVNDASTPVTTGSDGTEDAAGDAFQAGVDFKILYNPQTAQTAIRWLEAGRQPGPGSTYYVRYTFWTAHASLYLPA